VSASAYIEPGAVSQSFAATLKADTATCTFEGTQSSGAQAGTNFQPLTLAVLALVTVTVAGTVDFVVNANLSGADAGNVTSIGSYPKATGFVAVKIA
jgi:hypothetical protein